jgi:hypothetical protein
LIVTQLKQDACRNVGDIVMNIATKNMKKSKADWDPKKPQVVYENLPDSILEIRLKGWLIKQKAARPVHQGSTAES